MTLEFMKSQMVHELQTQLGYAVLTIGVTIGPSWTPGSAIFSGSPAISPPNSGHPELSLGL
jgi:hypothetical protein